MSAAVLAVARGLPACLCVFALSYGLFSHRRIPKGDQNVLATPPEMAHGAAERLSDRDRVEQSVDEPEWDPCAELCSHWRD